MELLPWFNEHGYDLLEAFAIVASLTFTTITVRREAKARHIGNLLAIVTAHREIWSALYSKPELSRILCADVDLVRNPVTAEEHLFVGFVIQHLQSTFRASQAGMHSMVGDVETDVRTFFSLPIPKRVWDDLKGLQNQDFVVFVEKCLQGK